MPAESCKAAANMRPASPYAYLTDPDGYVIELGNS